MKYRRFGKTNWQLSEIGYGMWGLADWKDTDPDEVQKALHRSVELGCNFFDTAFAYGWGKSEEILGRLVREYPARKLFVASKIPPKNRKWPASKGSMMNDVFPEDYIREHVDISLTQLGLEQIDLMQFHVWDDEWHVLEEWKKTILDITKAGKVARWGISINRWQPENSLQTLETGLIDAVQVVYNIFDQMPEDELFPHCEKLDIGVIARVPFDEGTLTGNLNLDTKFAGDDFRKVYFKGDHLRQCVEKAEELKALVPAGMNLPEMTLRFILNHPQVATTIPGMRKVKHAEANINASDGIRLDKIKMAELRNHRWVRDLKEWS